MPTNVFFFNSLRNSENKIVTTLLVQKPYLRTKCIEAKIEEDIDMKNQFKVKNLPNRRNHQDCAT